MTKKYKIKSSFLCLKDETSVKAHILNDDYFGSIATIVSLIKQQIKNQPECQGADFFKHLNELEKDLSWLQENYQINPKTNIKNKIPKGREKNQCSKIIKTSNPKIKATESASRLLSLKKKKIKRSKDSNEKMPLSAKRRRKEL